VFGAEVNIPELPEDYIFMNLENYEQTKLLLKTTGNGVNYLVPNVVFTVEMHEGRPESS